MARRQHEGVGTGKNPVDGSLVEFSAEVDALAEAAGGDLGTQAGRMRRIPPVRSDAQQPPARARRSGSPASAAIRSSWPLRGVKVATQTSVRVRPACGVPLALASGGTGAGGRRATPGRITVIRSGGTP